MDRWQAPVAVATAVRVMLPVVWAAWAPAATRAAWRGLPERWGGCAAGGVPGGRLSPLGRWDVGCGADRLHQLDRSHRRSLGVHTPAEAGGEGNQLARCCDWHRLLCRQNRWVAIEHLVGIQVALPVVGSVLVAALHGHHGRSVEIEEFDGGNHGGQRVEQREEWSRMAGELMEVTNFTRVGGIGR